MTRSPRRFSKLRCLLALFLPVAMSLAGSRAVPAAAREAPVRGEDKEVEEISIEEYDRLAAESPDQLPLGPVQALPPLPPPALSWTFIGPRPINFEYWSGSDDAAGRISSVAVDPRNSNVVYIAAAQGGVWKSVDGGSTWAPLADQLSSLASGALAFDPVNPDIVYYGTGEQHFSGDSFYGDGLFRSLDAGGNWTKLATKANAGSYISRVAVKPTDVNMIFVGSDRGFVRSTDGGATWAVTLAAGYCTDIAIDPATPSTVYAAGRGNGVYKSTNDGATWTKLSVGLPASDFLRINLALAPSNPLVLYASFVASSGGGLLGMYKTSDAGLTWSQLAGTPNYLISQGWYDNTVIVDPANANVCYAGGVFPYGGGPGGVIKTVNGGTSWSNITLGVDGSQLHPDQHFMTFAPDGALWIANDGGVWKTTTGGATWINRNHDLGIAQIYTVGVHPTSSSFLLGGTQDNGTLLYAGTVNWPQLIAGDGGPNAVEWDSPNIYYSTYVNLSSIDKWDSGAWQGDVVGPWSGDRANWCNGPLIVDRNVANTLLAGTYRVWRTSNSGASWSLLSGDLTGGSGHLRALAVGNGASNTIYSASSNGRVYVTTNASTWNLRNTGLPAAPLPDLWVNPADWQNAYLCADQSSGGRVYKTADTGVTWTNVTGNLPAGVRGMSLAVNYSAIPPQLFLGTDYGLYVSRDDGATWAKESANLPNCAVYDVGTDPVNGYLIAGTHGRGKWRAALEQVAPTATLTSPVGGEVWFINSSHAVTWSASDAAGVASVTLLLSQDGGVTYPTTIASGIPNTGSYGWTLPGTQSTSCRVKVMAYDPTGNTGVDISDSDFMIIDPALVGVGDAVTESFSLRPVAPNPCRPPAAIGFELPRPSRVSLELFDLAGRRVRALDEGLRGVGGYSVVWDGRDDRGELAPDGIYFYRLRAGAFEQTRRMVIVR